MSPVVCKVLSKILKESSPAKSLFLSLTLNDVLMSADMSKTYLFRYINIDITSWWMIVVVKRDETRETADLAILSMVYSLPSIDSSIELLLLPRNQQGKPRTLCFISAWGGRSRWISDPSWSSCYSALPQLLLSLSYSMCGLVLLLTMLQVNEDKEVVLQVLIALRNLIYNRYNKRVTTIEDNR